MKTVIIIQARMGSSRLPGKVLLSLEGKTILEHIISRLQRSQLADLVMVATSVKNIDQPIADLMSKVGIKCYRGDEHDVLSRYYFAAKEVGANTVVRCNGDCPLIDPDVVDKIISSYYDNNLNCDYVSNILEPTYPTGMHTEVFSFSALEKAYKEAIDPLEREHVTPYLYRNPNLFKLSNVCISENLSWHRWTLDFPEDLILISRIYAALYPNDICFGMSDILKLLTVNKDWSRINENIHKQATV